MVGDGDQIVFVSLVLLVQHPLAQVETPVTNERRNDVISKKAQKRIKRNFFFSSLDRELDQSLDFVPKPGGVLEPFQMDHQHFGQRPEI